jgi:hypothetical protein
MAVFDKRDRNGNTKVVDEKIDPQCRPGGEKPILPLEMALAHRQAGSAAFTRTLARDLHDSKRLLGGNNKRLNKRLRPPLKNMKAAKTTVKGRGRKGLRRQQQALLQADIFADLSEEEEGDVPDLSESGAREIPLEATATPPAGASPKRLALDAGTAGK